MRTQTFRVRDNRIRFTCPQCQAKRVVVVPPGTRRRSIGCPQCATRTPCVLNRRIIPRESQAGRCLLVTDSGSQSEVDLHDISLGGLGFDLPYNSSLKLKVRQVVRFKCAWNQRLLRSKYIVRSISGRRIGAEKVR